MRILKKILLVLAVIFGLFILISLFLPSKVKVERSAMINAPTAVVFGQVNNFHHWPKWSYWDNIDPAMTNKYEGPESGKGARHFWESSHKDVGHGNITIVESTPNSIILTDLEFEGMGTSHGGWLFKDTTGGCVATTYMEIEMGFFQRVFGLMMDGMLGADFEKSLAGLKKHCESLPAVAAQPIVVENTTTKEQIVATYKCTTSLKNITNDIGTSYQKIGEFMQKNKLEFAGPVFAIYHSFSPEKIEMECAIPVNKEVKGSKDISVKKMPAGNAVVAHYYGPYMGTELAHAEIEKFLKANDKKVTGSPYEVYVTDPGVEKDTAKWLTEVYYPVE
ncbi:MAG TPA: SRPBCC family protein [Bacteroidia bacterium]|jgi:effector-binding domain-containing protein